MALTRTKTIYINGTSKDGDRILGNFNASLSENGQMSINETVSESTNLDTVEADFNEFRELAKNELKKFNSQDTETNVSSDESGDKEVASTTSDNKPAGAITKADDKSETAKPDEAKVSGVKDGETKQPSSPVSPVASEEIKQPASSEEVKVSDVKDGENADESNQLRHQ